jgi:transglutaminase-like putative cysteine protease
MFLRVEHTTEFTYDGPIAEAYTELRLRPLEGGGQHCSSFRLATEPFGLRVREYRDHFGNDVHHFDVLESHDRLSITAVSTVMTPVTFISGRDVPTPLELHDYLSPTGYVPFSASVGDFAARHAASMSAPARARELMDAVRSELTYEPGATDVQTRADEVLALGRGVCQDFAHVLLAACRSIGIPARYVSGYLYDPSLEGDNAASHAWIDVWDKATGWSALDPTHAREPSDAYVRVAVGRDYADVPPTRGVYTGTASETLSVRVGLQAL